MPQGVLAARECTSLTGDEAWSALMEVGYLGIMTQGQVGRNTLSQQINFSYWGSADDGGAPWCDDAGKASTVPLQYTVSQQIHQLLVCAQQDHLVARDHDTRARF